MTNEHNDPDAYKRRRDDEETQRARSDCYHDWVVSSRPAYPPSVTCSKCGAVL